MVKDFHHQLTVDSELSVKLQIGRHRRDGPHPGLRTHSTYIYKKYAILSPDQAVKAASSLNHCQGYPVTLVIPSNITARFQLMEKTIMPPQQATSSTTTPASDEQIQTQKDKKLVTISPLPTSSNIQLMKKPSPPSAHPSPVYNLKSQKQNRK